MAFGTYKKVNEVGGIKYLLEHSYNLDVMHWRAQSLIQNLVERRTEKTKNWEQIKNFDNFKNFILTVIQYYTVKAAILRQWRRYCLEKPESRSVMTNRTAKPGQSSEDKKNLKNKTFVVPMSLQKREEVLNCGEEHEGRHGKD